MLLVVRLINHNKCNTLLGQVKGSKVELMFHTTKYLSVEKFVLEQSKDLQYDKLQNVAMVEHQKHRNTEPGDSSLTVHACRMKQHFSQDHAQVHRV